MQPASPADLRCPICRRKAAPDHAPFCSPRCRDVDLVNWLDDRYAIPVRDAEEYDGEMN